MDRSKTPEHIRIDERNHVEKPLLDQLADLQWEVLDLDKTQTPQETFRDSFTDVVMHQVLWEQLKVINPWLEDDQIEEVIRACQ
jgi:type I restriction enzyme R subunit